MAWLLRLSAACAIALLAVPAAASAAQDKARLDKTVRYLQDVQNKDGGFGERGSDPGFSVWAALAVASAGINPRDQRRPDGTDVHTYLARNTAGRTQSTDYAGLILVARAAGTSPRRFGRIDPLARLLELQRADGGFGQPPTRPASQVNGTAYAILALAGLGQRRLGARAEAADVRTRVRRAADWLIGKQAADGSWEGTDLTGSAIEALNAAGRRGTPAEERALAYLRSRQNPDGGFGTGGPGEQSNTASTSWVARGLVAARIEASTFRSERSGRNPLDYLAAMQQPDGSIPYSTTDRSNTIWITTFASPALAGASFPIAAVDREQRNLDDSDDPADPPADPRGDDGAQPGAGGTADGGDGDVTAGGGGGGAPLFSRPQPGSRGQAPGGERDTERANPSTDQGAGAVQGESVSGRLVGRGRLAAGGKGRSLGTAPGLRAAAAGGQAPAWLVAAIGVALLISAGGGIYLERRSVRA